VDGMLSYVKDGMIRTRWDHTAAATGRLTSACPNLQAVPRLPVTLQPLSTDGNLSSRLLSSDILKHSFVIFVYV